METSLLIAGVLEALTALCMPTDEAYFEFTDAHGDLFVIKLVEPRKINHARALLRGQAVSGISVAGKIVKRPADYNPRWSYHLKPRSIFFFDFAIEVCDAAIGYVEQHLDEVGGAFLPGGRWCPWTSRLTREVTVEVMLQSAANSPKVALVLLSSLRACLPARLAPRFFSLLIDPDPGAPGTAVGLEGRGR